VDAVFNINKPGGKTSYGIVALVKRLSGERRVGHAGTLDPDASGVLPVCVGRGTRLIEFLVDTAKSYRAQIELGTTTDTYDASGTIVHRGDASGISRAQCKAVLASFKGIIEQVPPMYSAIKYQGTPLYKLARAGIHVERKSRPVQIYHIEITDWQLPLVSIDVECGKGTYIRSLAHDLGQILGCGAHLKNLVRLKCGLFEIDDAVSLSQLEDAFRCGYWQQFAYPIDILLLHYEAIIVGDDAEETIKKGSPLLLKDGDSTGYSDRPGQRICRAYNREGSFLGVLRFDPEKECWQAKKIFP